MKRVEIEMIKTAAGSGGVYSQGKRYVVSEAEAKAFEKAAAALVIGPANKPSPAAETEKAASEKRETATEK